MKRSFLPVRAVLLGALLSLFLISSIGSRAATVAVTSLADTGEGTLRAALVSLNSSGDDGVVDLQGLSGTIHLASPLPPISTHLRILGPTDGVLHLNGQGQWPLLSFAAGTTGEVHRLVLTNALATATANRQGAAISNAGSLLLHACTLAGNRNPHGWGGAIFNQGHLTLLDSLVTSNRAEGETPVSPGGGGAGLGGAVFHDGGTWYASNCVFRGNVAVGGDGGDPNGGGPGGAGMGGAFYARTGDVALIQCRFEGNTARGGKGRNQVMFGGDGGGAFGGAGMGLDADLHLDRCEFVQNRAEGGAPGAHTDFIFGGDIGKAGPGEGGALSIWGGTVHLHQSLLHTNLALGSTGGGSKNGGPGAPGRGGALAMRAGNITAERSLWTGNRARGGDGGGGRFSGQGGEGLGGAVACLNGGLQLENCTLFENQAQGGDSPEGSMAAGTPGLSAGGALAVVTLASNLFGPSQVDLRFCTVASNACLRSAAVYFFGAYRLESGAVSGGGLYEAGGRLRLGGVLLAGNHSLTNADMAGTVESAHANLVQSPGNAMGLQPHDVVNVEPRLGPLALSEGGWPTLALLEGSPAIDRITGLEGSSIDQRGQSRPSGSGWDLGAFERVADGPVRPRFGAPRFAVTGGRVTLPVIGSAGVRYRTETSTDLRAWTPGPSIAAGDELIESTSSQARFFRLLVERD